MDTYLKDLIDLPAVVNKGDFVLKLSDGVEKPDETLNSYVVTDQLKVCFDDALKLIKNALASKNSKACYLHGSFGCGKSHFMAVLDLILAGNTKARGIPELSGVIAGHNDWCQGKTFLMVPYHMIGSTSMESAILGGYVDYVTEHHPEASVPAVFTDGPIFENAGQIRKRMGDEAFFAELNAGSATGGGKWGKMSAAWTAESYDAAVTAVPEFENKESYRVTGNRAKLLSAVIKTYLPSIQTSGQYVTLDAGLEVMSQHAQSLGYDAVILFLDELILWLASNAANQNFFTTEAQKISKLVEANKMHRPVPLISFVARQRDLRELVGDHVSGSQKVRFSNVADYWEGRFDTITLEDRNLPAIAEKRVLKPMNEAARKQIDDAFAQTLKMRPDALNVLMTDEWTQEGFRKIYPFSPAFMEMLVEMSFMLQRDRTALKVMLEILINRRETLALGEIIPVGDLFDAVSHGDEAISEEVKRCFHTATRLYEEHLRPMIEEENDLKVEALANMAYTDPKAMKLRTDDRLVKTLLLAALAPKLKSVQGLTARRLAALNHGTIKSPIPGREATMVIAKCRKWASRVGQIKVGDDLQDPTIAIHLSGVDTESILMKAQQEDNKGNWIRMVKDLLLNEFGIKNDDGLMVSHNFDWRGTKRGCDVLFSNVAELTVASLENEGERWKVVIDWPFDDNDKGLRDDIAKVQDFKNSVPEGARTLVILPSFFSLSARKELGKLVVIEHVLAPARFPRYASDLSQADREVAKSILENQQSQLKQRLIGYLTSAYGVGTPDRDAIDPTNEVNDITEHYWSLQDDLSLRPPAVSSLQKLFESLLSQAMAHQYPGHPEFTDTARLSNAGLKMAYENFSSAVENPEGRHLVEKKIRLELSEIVLPLKLGKMGDDSFLPGRYWVEHFERMASQKGESLTVGRLRTWMDSPEPMGLPTAIQDLIIMAYACQSNRAFWHLGVTLAPEVGKLPNDCELREVALPAQEDWNKALDRTAKLLGITPKSPVRNANNVGLLMQDVGDKIEKQKAHVEQYHDLLSRAVSELGITSTRLTTAADAKALAVLLSTGSNKQRIEALASWTPTSTDVAIGTSFTQSAKLRDVVAHFDWEQYGQVGKLPGDFKRDADAIKVTLADVFEADEYVAELKPAVETFKTKATSLVNRYIESTRPGPPPPAPPETEPETDESVPSDAKGSETVAGNQLDSVIKRIKQGLQDKPNATITITWTISE